MIYNQLIFYSSLTSIARLNDKVGQAVERSYANLTFKIRSRLRST
jgi:hypothetical protein